MSQKIIIPKGTIDSAHTTIIEIPNYLHETSTVVVTTPKTADASLEETWDVNPYPQEEPVEQNEENWEQNFDAEPVEEGEYSTESQDQYSYQFEQQGQETEGEADHQQVDEQSHTYVAEDVSTQPRRPRYDPYVDHMRRSMAAKKKELEQLKEQRQRMLEGDMGTYDKVAPQVPEESPRNLSEVPENMRGKQAHRESGLEKEKKRRHQEFERYQPSQIQGSYQSVNQGSPKYVQNPAYLNVDSQQQQLLQQHHHLQQQQLQQQHLQQQQLQQQQMQLQQQQQLQPWNPEIQVYPAQVHYPRPIYPRANYQKRQLYPQQVGLLREDGRQYQKARRKPTFSLPSN